MKALEVFHQQNGDVTKAFYAELDSHGPLGRIATCLFRAQKRSSRAKEYRRGKFRSAAYDVKTWSMGELCKVLAEHGTKHGIKWGWQPDHETKFAMESSWVLYVDLPQGQVSFHSPERLTGPDYAGKWDRTGSSAARIIQFADSVIDSGYAGASVVLQDGIDPPFVHGPGPGDDPDEVPWYETRAEMLEAEAKAKAAR